METSLLKSKLSAAAFVRKSRLVVGLDITADLAGLAAHEVGAARESLEKRAIDIVNATADYAVAFKFNRQLVLPLGLFDGIPRVIDAVHDQGLVAIMDCKINDIGNTNEHIARMYLDAGFDALIVNPFVGWEGGLDSVFGLARKRGRAIITLCYMSHPAAGEGYGLDVITDYKKKRYVPLYHLFAERALQWKADGVIVGATYPERIGEVRRILRDEIPILSPGVGAQGGNPREAIDAGASYVIVARSIVESDDPAAAARSIAADTA